MASSVIKLSPDFNLLDQMFTHQYEHVNFFTDPETGLKAIVSIHNTVLGPALGGCRFYNYESETDALKDVLRLSRAMTHKASTAGLDLGGGKSVIIGDPKTIKTQALMESFGRFVGRLGGKYITAEDSGTTTQDMDWIRGQTNFAVGSSPSCGGSGDPSPMTAYGVFEGIRACLKFRTGSPEPEGRVIAIQGLGNVGFHLAKLLKEAGAQLVVADITSDLQQKADLLQAKVVSPDEILYAQCDVLAPCALGGIITKEVIEKLQTNIIAGAANNQLERASTGDSLLEHDITYAPDFVINAGGLIQVADELDGYIPARAKQKTAEIFDTVYSILDRSKKESEASNRIAFTMAEERIQNKKAAN